MKLNEAFMHGFGRDFNARVLVYCIIDTTVMWRVLDLQYS